MSLTSRDLQAISSLLDQKLEQKLEEKLKPVYKEIRALKIKVNKTWNLLTWFAKDADERIVSNTRRIGILEKAIKKPSLI